MRTYVAVLDKEISYFNGVRMITVPMNTVIIVDKDTNVALIDGIHVEIFEYEYTVAC